MIYRIFSKNSFWPFALLPVILIGFRARLIFSPVNYLAGEANTPLWSQLFGMLKNNQMYLYSAPVILTMISALAVNRLTNFYSFTNRQTNLSGFLYILFTSGFIMVQELQPILIFTPFFIISIERLFMAVAAPTPMRHSFEATLWASAASLFYAKGVWFIPLLIIGMWMMRIFTLKSLMAAITGLLLPYLFAFTWHLTNDSLKWFTDVTWEAIITPVAFFNHSTMSVTYLTVASALGLISLLSAIRRMGMIKIITRKYYRFIIWCIFFPVALVFTPYFSFDVLPLMAIGVAMMSASMFHYWHKDKLKEIVLLAFLIITLITQWTVG